MKRERRTRDAGAILGGDGAGDALALVAHAGHERPVAVRVSTTAIARFQVYKSECLSNLRRA